MDSTRISRTPTGVNRSGTESSRASLRRSVPSLHVGPGVVVSVVIPHYGNPVATQALVTALQLQTDPVLLEIIVSDDASPEPYPDDPAITVVCRPANGGFGSAVNSGVQRATGDWLMILNSDLTISDHFIADWLAAATPWGDAVTAPRILSGAGDESWSGRHFPTIGHQFVEWLIPLARWRHLRPLHEAVGHDTRATGEATQVVGWVMGAALLMPTKLFRDVGGFDQAFHMNAEEVDLQRRLRARGIPSVYLGGVTAEHEGGGSSDPQKRRRWLVTSRLRYADKWATDGYPGGRRSLIAALTVASVINLVWNTGRRTFRRDVTPWATFRYEMSLLRGES